MTRIPAPLSFAVLCGVSLIVGWRPLASSLYLGLRNDEYTHILLILPVVAALVVRDWPALKPLPEPGFLGGAVLLTVSAAMAGLVRWGTGFQPEIQLTLVMLSLVAWWIGAFVLCFGTRIARGLLFPLCFLLWMVPLPSFAVARIVDFLQHGSAFAARCLFAMVDVPVSQEGVSLSIPGVTLEVAKECSSIRSSLMLVVTTMVLAQLFLRSPWRKALVVAVAIPLSVAKNGLRIFTIAMLGTRVDPGFLTGRLHHRGGIVFFLIALVGVFLLLWVLRRAEDQVRPWPPLEPVKS
ncbi:MAG: exosortase [Acidobacteriia bacterium]|nr:exosortase [Terriglobia bacterium]